MKIAKSQGGLLFEGTEEEPCEDCSAPFPHTPDLCAQRRIAAALEDMAISLGELNSEGIYTIPKG